MTTTSLFWTSFSLMAVSVAREKMRSVEVTSPVRKGMTPQEIFS